MAEKRFQSPNNSSSSSSSSSSSNNNNNNNNINNNNNSNSNNNNRTSISVSKPRGEVSLSAFAFLFSEMVQYYQNRVDSVADLEKKLEEAGYGIGLKLVELIGIRERATKRETRLVNMLQYVSNVIWRHLFNKAADNLERSMENEDEYMIHENSPITNTFVSVPSDMGQLNCAAYFAGLIAGVLDSTRFNAKVSAHLVDHHDGLERTVFLLKFSPEVMAREKRLG